MVLLQSSVSSILWYSTLQMNIDYNQYFLIKINKMKMSALIQPVPILEVFIYKWQWCFSHRDLEKKALPQCLAAVPDGQRVFPSTLRWSEISNRLSFPWWLGNMANGFAQGLSRHSLSIQFCSAFPTCQLPSGANSWTKMVCTFPKRSVAASAQHLAPVLPFTSPVLLFLLAPLSFFPLWQTVQWSALQ